MSGLLPHHLFQLQASSIKQGLSDQVHAHLKVDVSWPAHAYMYIQSCAVQGRES